uniref:Uncharacterized protein n=1 Tax=Manihot esculenta TaxID=3983 RepID=A0A2C9U8A8_MANES
MKGWAEMRGEWLMGESLYKMAKATLGLAVMERVDKWARNLRPCNHRENMPFLCAYIGSILFSLSFFNFFFLKVSRSHFVQVWY